MPPTASCSNDWPPLCFFPKINNYSHYWLTMLVTITPPTLVIGNLKLVKVKINIVCGNLKPIKTTNQSSRRRRLMSFVEARDVARSIEREMNIKWVSWSTVHRGIRWAKWVYYTKSMTNSALKLHSISTNSQQSKIIRSSSPLFQHCVFKFF